QLVVDPDTDIFLVHSRDFNLPCDIVLVLIYVHRGCKSRSSQCLFVVAVGVAEHAVHAILQSAEFAEWIPASKNCPDDAPETEFLIMEFVAYSRIRYLLSAGTA